MPFAILVSHFCPPPPPAPHTVVGGTPIMWRTGTILAQVVHMKLMIVNILALPSLPLLIPFRVLTCNSSVAAHSLHTCIYTILHLPFPHILPRISVILLQPTQSSAFDIELFIKSYIDTEEKKNYMKIDEK
jgi:hypothetical protein